MKKAFEIVVCLVLSIYNFSCRPSKLNIAGSYHWQDALKISSARLLLNRDSSFQYSFQPGDRNTINSAGHWSYTPASRHLRLTSDIRSLDDVIKVEETKNPALSPGQKRISIFDVDKIPYFGYIIVNPSSHSQTKFSNTNYVNNSTVLKDVDIREIAVNYFDLGSQAVFYTIRDTTANDFKIYIQLNSSKDYRYFNDQIWRVGNNTLTDSDTAFNKNGKKVYTKHTVVLSLPHRHHQLQSAPLLTDGAYFDIYQPIGQGIAANDVFGKVGSLARALLVPGHPDDDLRIFTTYPHQPGHLPLEIPPGDGKQMHKIGNGPRRA